MEGVVTISFSQYGLLSLQRSQFEGPVQTQAVVTSLKSLSIASASGGARRGFFFYRINPSLSVRPLITHSMVFIWPFLLFAASLQLSLIRLT